MPIYDFFQNFRISHAEDRAANANVKSESNAMSVRELQDKIDHLSLVCQAMCELMEEVGFNKTMLAKKIQEIDLRDGKLDGKFNPKKICSACNRDVAARHLRCIYCGGETSN